MLSTSRRRNKLFFLFNFRDGKVNIALLFSTVLIFVVMLWSVEAVTIMLLSPGNYTFNNTRNINFTFNATWDATQDVGPANCSIWINSTQNPTAWQQVAVNNSQSNVSNGTGAAGTVSWINYTFSSDGNYTWSVGCRNGTSDGYYNFSVNGNKTFFIDSLPPAITLDTTLGGVLADNSQYNITSYETAVFYINVSDNSTQRVWLILNSNATVVPIDGFGLSNGINESVNRTLTGGTIISAPDGRQQFYFNLSGYFDFNSSFTSPGPHSAIFCANDTFNRITCTNRSDFIIMGVNITQMENMFTTMQQFDGAGNPLGNAFGGLNITLGNGTEIPESTFMNPITGVTVGGLTHKNFTFIINITNSLKVHIVGAKINVDQFGNTSNSKINNTPSREVQQQLGTGFSAQMVWADIASFIPSEVSYQFGILQLAGTGYSKHMYCNGTSVASPNCHLITQCNATVFSIYNATPGQTTSSPGVIPNNDACWLESGTINDQALSSGFTYIFVDHFSGGLGGEDRSQINVTFNSPLYNSLNTTTASYTINFTLEDINSTGLNLTMNNSINVTLTLGGSEVARFGFLNISTTNLTCITVDTASPQNTTSVTCNVAYAFSNGTYLINVTARDTSNNSNPVNASTGSITIIVDQIPPKFDYYNFTNATSFNTTGDLAAAQLGQGNFSLVQGVAGTYRATLYVTANWTDNLTSPFQAVLQFYNVSKSAGQEWQTINTTTINTSGGQGTWSNMSFTIPTGHNNFEGANISFRVIANDTLGNVNTSGTGNFTIQINDTTGPNGTVAVGGYLDTAGANVSDTTPLIVWNITEGNDLQSVAIDIDNNGPGGATCNLHVNYTTVALANANRNGTITVKGASDQVGCADLTNGSHTARLTARDEWGNLEVFTHTFTVETRIPIINLTNLSNGLSTVNQSNVTVYTGINFTAANGLTALKGFSWTSSCNAAGETLSSSTTDFPAANISYIWPFNFSACKGAEANRTVSVTVTDSVGNSVTNLFQFAVDDLAPSIAVHSPTEGQRFTGFIDINVSALDKMNRVDTFGYYLDDNPNLFNHTINGTPITPSQGANTSILNLTVNLTPGTHTIKIRVNDTLGNARNSSVITFTQTGPIKTDQLNNSINAYLSISTGMTFNTTIRLRGADGSYNDLGSNETESDQTYEILLASNSSSANDQINVSLTEINGSGANWLKVNFSMFVNASTVQSHVQNNWTSTVLHMVYFNSSIDEFLSDANDYYGTVLLPGNITTNGLFQEIWWISNESKLLERTNVSQCTAAFTATTTAPCWNYTASGKTLVQVPHCRIVVAVNDSGAPVITVNTPSPNQTESMFLPNITVTSDTASCKYQVNKSAPSLSDNVSMSVVTTATDKYCIGQTERFKNLNTAIGYNITFFAKDANGNERTGVIQFNVSDTTAPMTDGSISSSPSSTSATVTVAANESVSLTVNYGTTNTSLASNSTSGGTDFNRSQTNN